MSSKSKSATSSVAVGFGHARSSSSRRPAGPSSSNSSARYAGRRLAHLIAVLFAVTFVTFALLNLLPGDVALAVLGNNVTPEGIARVRVEFGLDDSLPVRYLHWLERVLRGDFGRSYITGEPVMAALVRTVPVSLELMALSLLLSLALAVPTGLLAAYRAGRPIDRALNAVASLLLAAPSFMLGLVLMFFFALTLQWLPAAVVGGDRREYPMLRLACADVGVGRLARFHAHPSE